MIVHVGTLGENEINSLAFFFSTECLISFAAYFAQCICVFFFTLAFV